MEQEIIERLKALREILPNCYFEVVSKRHFWPKDDISKESISHQIVIYDFPYTPDFYTSEVKVVRFEECEKIFFTLRVEWLDPRDVDGLFDGVRPSELRENFIAESGAAEDIYDFWRLSLGELGYGFKDVGFKDIIEVDIQEENTFSKFVLRIEFSIEAKSFNEVIMTLSRLNEMWQRQKGKEWIIEDSWWKDALTQ